MRIGQALKSHFDLSQLTEFSFEMSPVDLESEKLEAMRSIGVTHARFGVQTFNPFYRRAFCLNATEQQVQNAATLLPTYFNRVSFDMLYGMHGQNDDEFFADLDSAVSLGLSNIAFYPINNAAVQPRLHKTIISDGRAPTSGTTKFYMNVILNRFMRLNGYLPHNGHEYVKAPPEEIERNPEVTEIYSFVYHDHVYGYSNQELLGFGVNAVSRINGYVMNNTASIDDYVTGLLKNGRCPMTVRKHAKAADESRGVILRLPYHGRILKEKLLWELIDSRVLQALDEIISTGFANETIDAIELTEYGWKWYVNLMYYLSPPEEKRIIDKFIAERSMDNDRLMENCMI